MIYAVSPSAQKEQIDKWCFKECGKIIVGGLIICDALFLPCREKNCPHMEKEMFLKERVIQLEDKQEDVTIRKLKPFEQKG